MHQPADAHAVGALFVLLHLLECHAQGLAERFLRHAARKSLSAHTMAYLEVEGAFLFWHATIPESDEISGAKGLPWTRRRKAGSLICRKALRSRNTLTARRSCHGADKRRSI